MKSCIIRFPILFFTAFFLIIPISNVYAQDGNETNRQIITDLWGHQAWRLGTNTSQVPIINYSETKGTPFLFNQFVKGSIQLPNNQESNVVHMNYNIYENLIVLSADDSFHTVDADEIKAFKFFLDDKVQELRKGYEARRLDADEFVRIMAEGKITLLYKPEINYQEGISSYGSATKQNEFNFNERYFVYKDGEVERLKNLNERTVFKLFDKNEGKIKSFVENNNLDLTKIDHVAELVKFYNSITES